MFIFHEGLPGSGKSYEAMVRRIIPALQKGRKVYAYMYGLDHEKIAQVAELQVEQVRELLVQLNDDDLKTLNEVVAKDSLLVLDEMQNHWPAETRNMPQWLIKFVSEHRQLGLDIIGMGQLLQGKGGVNALWVNRCDQKIVFEKLNVFGSSKKYRWTAYKGTHDGKRIRFNKVQGGSGKYEEKFFGTYQSYQDGADNTETYQDKRTNFLYSRTARLILIGAVIIGIGVKYAVGVLGKGGALEKSLTKQPQTTTTVTTVTVPASGVAAAAAPGAGAGQVQPQSQPAPPSASRQGTSEALANDYVMAMTDKFRPRLAGVGGSNRRGFAVIEWYDEAFRLKERLQARQLEEFGWAVVPSMYGDHVILVKGATRIAVTSWPMEPFGRASEKQIEETAGGERAIRARQDEKGGRPVADLPPSITSIPDDAAEPPRRFSMARQS
ncbi:zonular occludens toxin domain-containing protein [Ralstonia pseudosolanacearum]|uniref:zonular occludens toxin domain-containing protein n=1 Tax=Ralstonia pseudosolanacearum TaxID=1310165 RepID=UPI001FF93403|nr:zonular occludens toxin domain-containing protein [Ralstonia pseudosolanacearum]